MTLNNALYPNFEVIVNVSYRHIQVVSFNNMIIKHEHFHPMIFSAVQVSLLKCYKSSTTNSNANTKIEVTTCRKQI